MMADLSVLRMAEMKASLKVAQLGLTMAELMVVVRVGQMAEMKVDWMGVLMEWTMDEMMDVTLVVMTAIQTAEKMDDS